MGLGALQPMHLLLILAIVVIVFGAGKLGQVGGALGKSVREFKVSVTDPEEEARKAQEEAREAAEQARISAMAADSAKIKAEVKAEPVAAASVGLRREEI